MRVGRGRHTISTTRFLLFLLCALFLLFLVPVFVVGAPSRVITATSSTPRPTKPRYLDLSPPSKLFVSSRAFPVSADFARIYHLPEEFKAALKAAADKAPVNPRTGNRMIMFTIFNHNHANFAHNLLCSSAAVGVPTNFHIFIAMDAKSFQRFKELRRDVLFFDASKRNFQYEQFCKVKLFIQYQLLLWRVESVICDDDIVFLKNPLDIFREESHFEFATECIAAKFGPGYDYDKFNVGLMRVIPTRSSILVYERWMREAIPNWRVIDQDIFQEVMRPLRVINKTNIQVYRLPSMEFVVFRYYDPLDVMNGGLIRQNFMQLIHEVQLKQVTKPFAVHASWVPQDQKRVFMDDQRLWFLRQGNCASDLIPKTFPQLMEE